MVFRFQQIWWCDGNIDGSIDGDQEVTYVREEKVIKWQILLVNSRGLEFSKIFCTEKLLEVVRDLNDV